MLSHALKITLIVSIAYEAQKCSCRLANGIEMLNIATLSCSGLKSE